MSEQKILLVEDDISLANDIVKSFSELGLRVDHCPRGDEGLSRAQSSDYALVILDVMLPQLNGFDICRELRKTKPLLQVMMLTSRSSEVDRVLGLELGADDYLLKPFSYPELIARVRSKLRRAEAGSQSTSVPEIGDETISIAGVTIDPARRTVLKAGVPVKLTAKEFDLLLFLMRHRGVVFTKLDLLENVWEVSAPGYEHSVISLVRRLRSKLEDTPDNPKYVCTAHGVGYYFTAD